MFGVRDHVQLSFPDRPEDLRADLVRLQPYPALFRADLVVADTVYNPRETRMIQAAKAAGCKAAVGGIGMLLWQGVAAFKLFTGKDMPAQEVLEKFFS